MAFKPMTSSVALITGAATGIGQSIAEQLHEAGYRLAVTDINVEHAQKLARRLSETGADAQAFKLDVRSQSDIQSVFTQVEREMGPISVLINNAGLYPNHPSLEMTESQWDDVFDTNLKGTFFCCQAFTQAAVRNNLRGAIVNLASTSAFSARPGAAHYGASKAGVVMLTKSLAQEFGAYGVRVNAVAPGLIEVGKANVSTAYRDQFTTMVPSGRTGTPADIAGVVSFLVSPAADYVNGECIVVDGGFLTGRTLQRSKTE
jgi:3-oxoacyl-[acyl-carrier protein] reductase